MICALQLIDHARGFGACFQTWTLAKPSKFHELEQHNTTDDGAKSLLQIFYPELFMCSNYNDSPHLLPHSSANVRGMNPQKHFIPKSEV